MDYTSIVEKRLALKKMLNSAKALPDELPIKVEVIRQLEVKILLLKLHLNSVY